MNERLKQVRKLLKLSQSEFAQKLGIKQTSLSSLELNKRKFQDRYIKLICLTFSVNEEWLREGKGGMFLPSEADVPHDTSQRIEMTENGYNFTDTEKKLINSYLNLSERRRSMFNEFLEELFWEIEKEN